MSKALLKSGILFSAMTFISRVLGLVRDVVIANLLGASAAADVFILTNKIPNFLRRLFAEGAFAQAFVPVLTEYKENKTIDDTHLLIARVSGTLGCILMVTTLIGVIASPVVIMLFGTGWFIEWLQGDRLAINMSLPALCSKLLFLICFLWL